MPFDPSQPAENSPLSSAPLRGNFNGLKDLIDAISTLTAAQVDGVNTLNPGEPATAAVSVSGNTLHFTFGIPAGVEGSPGPEGAQGPPFASAVVDGVNTLPPGSSANVSVTFDGTSVRFTFDIPQGDAGSQGEPGPAGEVTQAALEAAISGTSSNSNGVDTLETPFTNDPPTLADMETLRAAYNTLVLALRRA